MNNDKMIKESRITESILNFLIEIPLFDELKSNDLKVVARQMSFVELKPGSIVFNEGDKGDYVCFVVEGILDIVKTSAQGKNVVIASLPRGRSIGEMAIIDNFPRSATVCARTNTTLVILRRQGFDLILAGHPTIGIKILRGLARLLSMNLRKTSSRLADYMLPVS